MAEIREITKIEHLNGNNYQSWKYNMKLVLMERGLWGFINGTEQQPAEDATAQVKSVYQLKSDKAYSLIALSVDKNIQVHISTTTDPLGAWDVLRKQFEFVSITQIVRLNRRFYAATMKEDGDIMEHITYMTTLAEQLRDMKEEISDQKFATVFLGSLPDSYENFISSLNAQKVEDLKWENVKSLLVEEYMKRKEKQTEKRTESPGQNDALFSKKSNYSFRGRNHFRGGRQYGNNTRDGGAQNPRRPNQMRGIKCFKCEKFGHIVKNCPLNKKSHESNITEEGKQAQRENEGIALTSTSTNKGQNDQWFIDSGATKHMTFQRNIITDYKKYDEPSKIYLGDNRVIEAYGEGKVELECHDGTDNITLNLHKVLFVPEIRKNLLSVPAMTQMEAEVIFDDEKCYITKNGKTINIGHLLTDSKLFVVNTQPDYVNITTTKAASLRQWHCRYGHLNFGYINKLAQGNLVTGMKYTKGETNQECEACARAKMHRIPFPKQSLKKTTEPLELIHSDVCGPMNTDSIGGSKYILTFTDDYSRYVTVYFLKNKSEVYEKFQEYVNMMENFTGLKVKTLRTDNGGEYVSNDFSKYCASKGIVHQYSNPYTPEQNGVSERLNRTLLESAKSMIFHANMPINFWAEAVNTAVHLHNRSPTTSLNMKTPYECWFGKKPDVSNLKVFGSICFIHTPSNLRRKLDPRSQKAIFIGYPLDTKGYKLYDLEAKKFVRSRDVVFHENKFHDFEAVTEELIIREDVPEEKVNVDHEQHNDAADDDHEQRHEDQVRLPDIEDEENTPAVGASIPSYEENFMKQVQNLNAKRQRKAPKKFSPDECNITESLTAENEEPQSISEALNGKNATKWKQALEEEYNSLMSNETWDLVPRPEGCNVIGSKWVMKIKRDADGNVDRHKARFVAQGYAQTHGVDYEEIFSPVARHSSIRTLLALANKHDLEIHQMDVKTAFLNGYIEHDIYMSQPDGFVDQEHPEYVCKLNKSLYGLKQSARCWNQTLDSFLMKNGYRKSNADNCIYVKSIKNDDGFISFVILAVYVDDIIPISNDIDMLNAEKDLLCKRFEMTDQGEIHFVLGMTIKRDRENKTMFINQQKYLESVLDRFGMANCKPISTPIETVYHKRTEEEEGFDQNLYQQAMGCLTYISTATRPDISVAVSILSSYMSDPSKEHWSGVKRLLRYIKGTLNFGLKYSASESNEENEDGDELYGYSDANWAGDVDSRRSTSGYVFKVGNCTVSWCSKKQASVTKSTTEAEYVALSQATQEAIWMRQLLSDIGCKSEQPTTLYEDNQGAIEISKNARFHNRTKHIDVRFHFIREKVVSKEVKVIYCSTEDMLADIMTKGLTKKKFQRLRRMLNICSC